MKIEIDKQDVHYLGKLILNGRLKAEQILRNTECEVTKKVMTETLLANERLTRAFDKAILQEVRKR